MGLGPTAGSDPVLKREGRGATARRCAARAVPGSAAAFTATDASARDHRVVAQGRRVETVAALDPTCGPLGRIAVDLPAAPAGGRVATKDGLDRPNLPTGNPRSSRDRGRVPVTMLFHRANAGFTGPDSFAVEDVFAGGSARRVRSDVTVR